MIRRSYILVGWGVWLLFATSSWAGDVLDRVVATVNGQIILQSDWQDALRYEACVDGRSAAELSSDERKAALDRLIDQELLREQMHASDFQHATDKDVAQRLTEIRQQHPGAETSSGWQAVLASCGLTENQLSRYVGLQLDLMRLVDARLRPNVSIDAKSIESYYNREFLPQLRQSGAKEVPLADVTPKIKELLTQQRVNELLVAWLHNLRSGSDIRTAVSRSSPGDVQ